MATEQAPPATSWLDRTPPLTCDVSPRRVLDRVGAFCTALTEQPISLHAAAVLRIGYGLLYLTFLVREFPHRDEI